LSWFYLIFAGLFEIGFTTFLKLSAGFTKVVPTLIFVVFSVLSFTSLSKAIDTIPLGTAYAVWTGIGAAGTVLMGILLFGELQTFWKLFFVCNIIASIAGLKFLS